jgi:hypothetical protein
MVWATPLAKAWKPSRGFESEDDADADESVMRGNQGAPFGLKVVPHYGADVGDFELGRCAVFKALDTMSSLGH